MPSPRLACFRLCESLLWTRGHSPWSHWRQAWLAQEKKEQHCFLDGAKKLVKVTRRLVPRRQQGVRTVP